MSDPYTPGLTLEESMPLVIEKMNAGDYTAAYGLISKLCKAIPDNTDILGWAAIMAFSSGHIDEAISILSDLIEKEPTNQNHYNNLVKILLSSEFAPARLVEVCTQAPPHNYLSSFATIDCLGEKAIRVQRRLRRPLDSRVTCCHR